MSKVFLSAGHHTARQGASFRGRTELVEALYWISLIANGSKNGNLVVVPPGLLSEKVDFINTRCEEGDVAIEIHFNSAKDSEGNNIGRGCETLYFPESKSSKDLAELVNGVVAKYVSHNRGVKEGWYRRDKSRGPDYFLVRTVCPAVIVEPEFIHRLDLVDCKRICSDLSELVINRE